VEPLQDVVVTSNIVVIDYYSEWGMNIPSSVEEPRKQRTRGSSCPPPSQTLTLTHRASRSVTRPFLGSSQALVVGAEPPHHYRFCRAVEVWSHSEINIIYCLEAHRRF
jgi:hypothetical protein